MSLIAFVGISLIWTGLLAGCGELLTRGTAHPRFARTVWRVCAALMVVPWLVAGAALVWPSAIADIPVPDIPDFGFATDTGAAPEVFVANEWPVSIATLVAGVLVMGWVLRALCALRAQVRLQKLKASAQHLDDPQISAISNTYAHDLNLPRAPQVHVVEALASPFAAGTNERRIYLPSRVIGSGHEPMIIAHESLHIASGDLITRPFERLVADILWFSPFAWIARRRLDYLREAVCDAATIALTGQRKAYARALVDVARTEATPMPLPVASLILNDRGSLKRRVTSLLGEEAGKPARKGLVAAVLALVALPLAVAQGVKAAGPSDVFTHPILAAGKITSTFGERKDPFTGKKSWHAGIDIAGELGEPVMTPADGKVVFANYKSGYGKMVVVELEDGRRILFGQLKKIKVKEGVMLEAGQYVGLLGKSGRATGPHLHIEVMKPFKPAGTGSDGKPKYKQYDPERFDIDFIAN